LDAWIFAAFGVQTWQEIAGDTTGTCF
jgi:hypothetical protein